MLTIPVGNVTAETELSYEYGVRNKKEEATPPPRPQDSGKEETLQDKGAVGGGKLLSARGVASLSSCSC